MESAMRERLKGAPARCWLSIALLTMPLAGCVTARSEAMRAACPPLASYPPEFQRRAAAELQAMPAGSAVGQMIVDYGRLRDACRVMGGRNG